MAFLDAALQNLAHYPRWLVAICTIIVAAAVVWLLTKALKLTLYLAALAVFGVVVWGVYVWWQG
jgi:small basic protein